MNFRLTIAALVMLLLVFGFFFYEQTKPAVTPNADELAKKGLMLQPQPAGLSAIEYVADGATQLAFKKDGIKWNMTQPVAAPADAGQVEILAEQIRNLKSQDQFPVEDSGAHSLKEAGLQPPHEVVKATDDAGKVHALDLGKRTANGAVYARMEDGPANVIYTVPTDLVYKLDQKPEDFRSKQIAAVPADQLNALRIKRGNSTVALTKSNGTWRIEQPIPTRANATVVDDLAGTLASLDATDFSAIPKNQPGVGLNPPVETVTITQGPATTMPATAPAKGPPSQTTTIELGNYTDLNKSAVYASVAGSDTVYTLDADKFKKLDKGLNDLRDPAIVTAPAGDSTRIEIAAAAAATQPARTITLAKVGPDWSVTAPEKMPADNAAVGAMLGAINALRANKFVDGPGDLKSIGLDPPRQTITLTITGQRDRETLQVGKPETAEPLTPVKRAGDPTVYLVQTGDLAKLVSTPEDLRNKAVANVPADAVEKVSVTGQRTLTLERTGNNWTVTDGKSKPVPADPSTVSLLLADVASPTAEKWLGPTTATPAPAFTVTLAVDDSKIAAAAPPLATQTAGPRRATHSTRTLVLAADKNNPPYAATFSPDAAGLPQIWSFKPAPSLVEHITKTNYAKTAATQTQPSTEPATAP